MTPTDDNLGRAYSKQRKPDPRIAALLNRRIGKAQRILNIGAGTGSYEPAGKSVVAVEPSKIMIAQRPAGSAPVVQAVAEQLPFPDRSFDLAMALLSVHHWTDWRRGIKEAMRVADGRLVIFTWIGFPSRFWLTHYLPEIEELDEKLFPTINQFSSELGPTKVDTVPVPHDCRDGFLCAYWRRPAAYLDAAIRSGISIFAKLPTAEKSLQRLENDLSTGEWNARFGDLLQHDSHDYGYRIISCGM
jgi:SAM-dependent methyltransferase